jgi:hypothetical protein|tara:strand:- start:211 stop:411 length:201 start_codon:yes stop_codon:yes gene_type:complete
MVEVIQYIMKKIIQPKMEDLKENITSGVDSYEKYQYLVGRYRSLNDLQQDLRDLLKKQEMFDDDDK